MAEEKSRQEGEKESESRLSRNLKAAKIIGLAIAWACSSLVLLPYYFDVGTIPDLRLQDLPFFAIAVTIIGALFWGVAFGVMLLPGVVWLWVWGWFPPPVFRKMPAQDAASGGDPSRADDRARPNPEAAREVFVVLTSMLYTVLACCAIVHLWFSCAWPWLLAGVVVFTVQALWFRDWVKTQYAAAPESEKWRDRFLRKTAPLAIGFGRAVACIFGGLSFLVPIGIVGYAAERLPGASPVNTLIPVVFICVVNLLPILIPRAPRLPAVIYVAVLLPMLLSVSFMTGLDDRISWAIARKVGVGNLPPQQLVLKPEGCEQVKNYLQIPECPKEGVYTVPNKVWILNKIGEKYWFATSKMHDGPGGKCQNDTDDHLAHYGCFSLEATLVVDGRIGTPEQPAVAAKPEAKSAAPPNKPAPGKNHKPATRGNGDLSRSALPTIRGGRSIVPDQSDSLHTHFSEPLRTGTSPAGPDRSRQGPFAMRSRLRRFGAPR
ncbi:MAG: hypothetical protein OSA97_05580 [Nevskia sp.]|nr:hypothetical protein [Nevskia sp.]